MILNKNHSTHKWVKPEDLNPNSTLYGGRLLEWIDMEAALFTIITLKNNKIVTKYISEINFMSTAEQGDIIELIFKINKIGKSSITLSCLVKNIKTHAVIITVDKIVMVNLDKQGFPVEHGIKTGNL